MNTASSSSVLISAIFPGDFSSFFEEKTNKDITTAVIAAMTIIRGMSFFLFDIIHMIKVNAAETANAIHPDIDPLL